MEISDTDKFIITDLLEKLTVFHVPSKLSAFDGTRMFITVFTRALQ
jgi:hypothetical protein